MSQPAEQTPGAERREFPRLKASFVLRYGVCGDLQGAVPGFTDSLSLGGISFLTQDPGPELGTHLALEITVPGFDDPLYFLGVVIRSEPCPEAPGSRQVAARFAWLGKSDRYREKLEILSREHQTA